MTLYRYPEKAQFNKVIPKSTLYQQGDATRKMQQRFVDCVEQVMWAYKLSPETINLSATTTVKEIQIFRIDCRVQAFDESILAFIDKAIPSPIIYELYFDNQVKTIATYKRQSHADKSKMVIGQYYQSDWQAVTASRADLPVVLSLGDLYEHVIEQLLSVVDVADDNILAYSLPIDIQQKSTSPHMIAKKETGNYQPEHKPAQHNATIEEKIAHVQKVESLQKQIDMLKKRIKKEKQFNRQVDMNMQLHKLTVKLQTLRNT